LQMQKRIPSYEKLSAIFNEILSTEELDDVLNFFQPVDVKSGELYLDVGEIPKYFSFVASGLFRYYYITKEGEEFTKHFSIENTFMVSISAFLQNRGSYFFIEALEDSTILSADLKHLYSLSKTNMNIMNFMVKLFETLFILKEKREADFLLKDARERYEEFLLDYPGLEDRVMQYHIASYLGINPVSLSRIRKGLVS